MKKNFWITASIVQKIDKYFSSKKTNTPITTLKQTPKKDTHATEKKK